MSARRTKFGRSDRSAGGHTHKKKVHSSGPSTAKGGSARPHRKDDSAPASATRTGGHHATRTAIRGGGAKSGAPPNTIGARPGSTVEGTVSANRAGYGFLRVDGLKDSVFIPPGEMRGVMHGDKLRVRLSRD